MTPAETELDRIVADFLREAESGRNPNPAEWLTRYPQYTAELSTFFADLGRFGSFLGLGSRASSDETVDYRGPGESPTDSQRFGEYELLGEVGRGAMGVVYRARPTGTNLVVALKRVRPGGLDGAEAVRRFREEVENASGLKHPHIVPIYHVGEQDGRPFFTMALVGGGSLEQKLPQLKDDLRAGVALMAKVARAVHYAHQRQLLHRDLKPGNILLDDQGEPQVADFGLATRLDAGGAAAGGPMAGSLPWMAPEAVRHDSTLSTSVDVWALGVILYELLTGVRPFGGKDRNELRHAILQTEPIPPRTINTRFSRDLDAVCRRCLEKDPDKRYESASAWPSTWTGGCGTSRSGRERPGDSSASPNGAGGTRPRPAGWRSSPCCSWPGWWPRSPWPTNRISGCARRCVAATSLPPGMWPVPSWPSCNTSATRLRGPRTIHA